MEILHLAAFTGNSGDCLSHAAFQSTFREKVSGSAVFNEVNLRDFYKNNRIRSFDANFSKEINAKDAFILGGDLMFDLRWTYSATGTTLDFSRDFIDSIRVPVILNGVGYAEAPGVDIEEGNMASISKKFKTFVDYIAQKPNWLLTLRNDGSYERIRQRFGEAFASRFFVVPDNGFHFKTEKIMPNLFEDEKRTIGICFANDSFTQSAEYEARRDILNCDVVAFIKRLIQEDCRIVLIPHMPKDLEVIHTIYQQLGEKAFRYNVIIAPYNNLDKLSTATLLQYYKSCHYILATRFHSSIIPLICKIPVTGLAAESLICPERISALYQSVGLQEFCLNIPMDANNVQELLYQKYLFTMKNKEYYDNIVDGVMKQMSNEREVYFAKIKEFLINQK